MIAFRDISGLHVSRSLGSAVVRGVGALMLVLPMAGCDFLGSEAGTQASESDSAAAAGQDETKPVEPAVETVPAFTPRADDDAAQWLDRMPADDGRTILIPATTLFPGNARVDPQVENPYSGDAEAIAAGERHYNAYNCAGCHAPLGGGGMGPPFSDTEWIYGGEPAQIYLSIMHGRGNGMPAWASMLPGKTAWELVAYIETLDQIDNYAREAGFDERSPARNQEQDGGAATRTQGD